MAASQLILVDGAAFLFRAYHAIRAPLSTAGGQTTHAVFGMLNMLRSLRAKYQPTRLAVVLDAAGKTFRHELYPDYKANRPPMPEDLRAQWDYARRIIIALGIPLVSIPGVEADDVIGTLTTQARALNLDTLIVSGDKDLAQLVNARAVMLDTKNNMRLDAAGVEKKFGVPPRLITDYLALVGDASDNIPGIPKVGPKTAAAWLQKFGGLDELIARADEIAGKVGESLRENLARLELSRKLVALKVDVELDCGADELRVGAPDTAALREMYTELEFHAWLQELDGEADAANADDAPKYETILNEKSLTQWLAKLRRAKLFAVDTETTSLDAQRAELVGIAFAVKKGEAAYLPLQHNYTGAPPQLSVTAALKKLRPLLEDAGVAKVGQNLKYDMQIFARYGIALRGVTHDTMLMAYVLDAGKSRHDLDTLARNYLGAAPISFAATAGRGKNQLTFDQVHIENAARYAAEDADLALQLQLALAPKLKQQPKLQKLYADMELPLLTILARIESNGVKINANMLARQSAELAAQMTAIERQAYAVAGTQFNIASPQQIQHILYEQQGLGVSRKTPKGKPSTAISVLQELAAKHELPRLILEHRGLAKLKSTYTDKLPGQINPRTGRVHTSYHQAVAVTGRLSSATPNLQNIPIRTAAGGAIRAAFIAEPNYKLVAADYSQIELRILAHLSADEGLCAAFNRGLDVHRATAAEVFGVPPEKVDAEQRRRAKAINFGLIYGMSAFGLARQLNIEQREARDYMEIYFARYPRVLEHMEELKTRAREQGYVETLYGRRMYLPEINSRNMQRRKYAERTAINAPMQGSAADLIKLAMLAVDKWLAAGHCDAKIIMQVHDELVLEAAAADAHTVAEECKRLMTEVAELKVPLAVDTGIADNWKDAH